MAAGGFKEFVAGEVLDEDSINDYLLQGMLVFAGTAARGSAITSPVEGQFSFLKDSDSVEFYDGSAWVTFETGVPYAQITSSSGAAFAGADGSATAYIWKANGTVVVGTGGLIDYLVVGGGG